MSKTRKLRPADRHITRAECQALIVHTLNEVFGTLAEPTEPAIRQPGDPVAFSCTVCSAVYPNSTAYMASQCPSVCRPQSTDETFMLRLPSKGERGLRGFGTL